MIMNTKIKTLCRIMIPIVLFSITLVVTSCQQDEFAGEENMTLKSAVIPELTLAYPSIVIPGQDFEINYSSTCGKVMIERGYINGDPITEGDVIIGYEKIYNGLACDTEFLQWESIGNNGFLPCSGGKITENWSRPGNYVYRAKMNHKAVHKSGCPDCTTFKGNQFECFTIECKPAVGGWFPPIIGTFADTRDGKIYKWIKIGNQFWMLDNLAWLPSETSPSAGSVTVPCYYKYRTSSDMYGSDSGFDMSGTYGILYNWRAALTACPAGWHLPSNTDWAVLTVYLGGAGVAGGKMKINGTAFWFSPNTGATNESHFSALPGGRRNFSGGFSGLGYEGIWWSSTEYSTVNSWSRFLSYDYPSVGRNNIYKECGFSLRCLRDN